MRTKTRFCPSPTGHLHLGNVRTALFSVLFARANQGKFLLRIEDTDIERSTAEYTSIVLDDLRWLGLNWDEGPEKDGGDGPYFQSERKDIYERYYSLLVEKGFAYPCFCSEESLAISRKMQLAAKKPPRYLGGCDKLPRAEVEKRIQNGEQYALRFHVPEHRVIEFVDFVKGEERFLTEDLGDFIIRRTSGMPSFMFCNAIDDALMGITHVIRGEDHLTNTPRQILILQALGFSIPEYGHLPLIVGMDGAPLAKRHGSASVFDLRADGVLPLALLNYLARLGHHYDHNKFMSLLELAEDFRQEKISKSPAKFDRSQLLFWQKHGVMQLVPEDFWSWAGKETLNIVPENCRDKFVAIAKQNVLFPHDVLHLARSLFMPLQYAQWNEEKMSYIKTAGEKYFEKAEQLISKFEGNYKIVIEKMKEELKLSGKALFMPLRLALTGELHGAELAEIFELLSGQRIIGRIIQIKSLLKS